MRVVFIAVVGFALGMAAAHLRERVPRFEWPSLPAMPSLPAGLPGAALSPSDKSLTLRTAIEPVYNVLFGALDDRKAVAVAVEETVEIEKLMLRVQEDPASNAARAVVTRLKAACVETDRFGKANAQPVSQALGGARGSTDFFGSVFEKRWRANMAVLARKSASDWQRFVEVDAATPCPEKSQAAIATLLAERRLRELERTAIRTGGTVVAVLDGGALVELPLNVETIFVSAFRDAEINSQVNVMVHPAGVYHYATPDGAKKSFRKYRFFRHATKADDQLSEPPNR